MRVNFLIVLQCPYMILSQTSTDKNEPSGVWTRLVKIAATVVANCYSLFKQDDINISSNAFQIFATISHLTISRSIL